MPRGANLPVIAAVNETALLDAIREAGSRPIDGPGKPRTILQLERSGVDRERVSGIGVAAPGPIDAGTGVVVSPPLVPGWSG
jgi:predicted NBD/HSP70 family sugar kinase